MKKILWIVSLLAGSGVFGAQGAAALLKGEVKTYDMDGFRLHVYLTQDALGDATTVVEGRDGLVILEMPLFKENLKEFAGYLKGLGKPVVKVVADYHVGGVADYAPGQVVLVEGMSEFAKGAVYGGMLEGFKAAFGDAAYPQFGAQCYREVAIQATHGDGSMSLELAVESVSRDRRDGSETTAIAMKDKHYPFFVTLFYKTYDDCEVIETWTEISHTEKKPVTLYRFASAYMPVRRGDTWLTHFHGTWGAECYLHEEPLTDGMNVRVAVRQKIAGQLVVPKSAVVIRDNLEVLFRYKEGRAQWTYVHTSLANSREYVVEANRDRSAELDPGDLIIVSGNLNLADGSEVTLTDNR